MPNKPLLFGNVDGTCQICFKVKHRFGTLLDPNGHTWPICAECINTLWHENHATTVEKEIEDKALKLIQERLFGNDPS